MNPRKCQRRNKEDEKKEKIFEFTKKKTSPTKAGVHDQLDLLFKRK